MAGRAGAFPFRAAAPAALFWACFERCALPGPFSAAAVGGRPWALEAGRAAAAGAGRFAGRDGPDAAGGGTMPGLLLGRMVCWR